MTTLYTAKKYAVPALEAHCVEFLKKNLRADNAFMLLTQVRWNIHVVHDNCLQKKLRKMVSVDPITQSL